jgi:hypothetical protein
MFKLSKDARAEALTLIKADEGFGKPLTSFVDEPEVDDDNLDTTVTEETPKTESRTDVPSTEAQSEGAKLAVEKPVVQAPKTETPKVDYTELYSERARADNAERELQALRRKYYEEQNKAAQSDYSQDEPITRREAAELLQRERAQTEERNRQAEQMAISANLKQERQALERDWAAIKAEFPDFETYVPSDNVEKGWAYFQSRPKEIGFGQDWKAQMRQVYRDKSFDAKQKELAELQAKDAQRKEREKKRRETNKDNLSLVPRSGGGYQEPVETIARQRRGFNDKNLRSAAMKFINQG